MTKSYCGNLFIYLSTYFFLYLVSYYVLYFVLKKNSFFLQPFERKKLKEDYCE